MSRTILFLILPLLLSAFTHLWNPIGFPDMFYDEGIYIRRALNVLNGLGLQESNTYYDHPYFGQIFLAGIFSILGYPNSLHATTDLVSIETLYVIPRVLMGLLAVVDTLLIYKISEFRYGRNVAIIASILFAVMPVGWFTRRILLDSILLPFLLSAILLAIYSRDRKNDEATEINEHYDQKISNNKLLIVILSGELLGLSIFTKIPTFTVIPLIAYLIFKNNNKSWRILGIWFIPVILIPMIWPAYSVFTGQFDAWLEGVFNQTQREDKPPVETIQMLLRIDPIMIIIGAFGLFFAAIKKDIFLLLWIVPSILFRLYLGYFPDREFIPLLPIFCIAASVPIVKITQLLKHARIIQFSIVVAVSIIGLTSTIILINTNVTASQFQTLAFVASYLDNHENEKEKISVVSSPIYSWVLKDVFNHKHVYDGYRDILYRPVGTDKILLIADNHFMGSAGSNQRLEELYNSTKIISEFTSNGNVFDTRDYPYTSLRLNNEGLRDIEVRLKNNIIDSKIKDCIGFDVDTIIVSCMSANLTDVYNMLSGHNLRPLSKESNKTWILNANLEIKNGSNFYLNSTDTSWLKINSTNGLINEIKSEGNLLIDSVKITGWNTIDNDYSKIDINGTMPRSYILVSNGIGTTNITNSEIGYLGYKQGQRFGLTYYTGSGSTIKNNIIHDLWYGFNSRGNVHNITIENNVFHNNIDYGIYPQDGAHDIMIKNNTVYNNGLRGIICSANCQDITIESNRVFNNTNQGIVVTKNVTNSEIRNNTVYDNTDHIAIYDASNNNQVYDNVLMRGNIGVRLNTGSSSNHVFNNSIMNSNYGVYILKGASNNTIDDNKIINSSNTALYVKDNNTNNNIFKNNYLLDNRKNEINRNLLNTNGTLFINNTVESTR